MPVCATEWRVLPHGPLVQLHPDLWRVEGALPSGLVRTTVFARLPDGRVIVHNAMALDEPELAQLDAWGEVAAILVPNAFHREDCRIFQQRYPEARVYAPRAAGKAVEKATPVHGTYDDVPQAGGVRVRHLPGVGEREGVVEVEGPDGLTVVFNDLITNVAKAGPPVDWFVGPTGQVSIPRFARWLWMKDKRAFEADLRGLLARRPVRVVPGHGPDLVGESGVSRMGEALALL
jgi:hypothetical protein